MISEMTDTQYLIAFSDARTAFSDSCIRKASELGRMYCERAGNTYRGFICTEIDGQRECVLYAYTKPQYRRSGIFSSLVSHIVRTAERDVLVSVPERHPFFAAVDAVCERLGFASTESIHTFNFDSSQKQAWQRVKDTQRFDACCSLLQRTGCEAVSFADADEDILRQVRESHTSSFQNPLDPSGFFRGATKKLSMDLSCAAVKDGKLLAYSLLTQQDHNSVVFEQMASSADGRGFGAVLLPFVYSVDRFFERGYHRWAFAIYPSNTESNRIRKTLEKEVHFDERVTRCYRRERGGDAGPLFG